MAATRNQYFLPLTRPLTVAVEFAGAAGSHAHVRDRVAPITEAGAAAHRPHLERVGRARRQTRHDDAARLMRGGVGQPPGPVERRPGPVCEPPGSVPRTPRWVGRTPGSVGRTPGSVGRTPRSVGRTPGSVNCTPGSVGQPPGPVPREKPPISRPKSSKSCFFRLQSQPMRPF